MACGWRQAGRAALRVLTLWVPMALRSAHAESLGEGVWPFCPTPAPVSAAQADGHLQMAQLIQNDLDAQGVSVGVVSRSGLNLRAIGHLYSHAGWLRGPRAGSQSDPARTAWPWTVRQLYFDCASGRPRVFDEGLPGFVRGVAPGSRPRLSVVWWPVADTLLLQRAVGDDALAVALVAPRYQAQAHPWSGDAQNCNQWLVELLAAAWSGARDRAGAQRWLLEQGYAGSRIDLPWVGWLLAAAWFPHMGLSGHPPSDLQALQFEVSMPMSLEAFVRRRWPQAQRMEWCLDEGHVVVRRGWEPLDEACTVQSGDRLHALVR